MKKIILSTISLFSILMLYMTFSSCKKDEPYVKPKISFASDSQTIKESDGTVNAQINLDKAANEDFTINFSMSGTAVDKANATNFYDYEITNGKGQLSIKKGDVSANIEIKLYSDFDFENDETIEISIDNVSSKNIEITSNNTTTITLKQEDGLRVSLGWGVGENYTNVDMDLFLWMQNGSSLGLLDFIGVSGNSATSVIESFTPPESFFLPTAIAPDGSYGLSCNYYGGTQSPMNFQVSFVKVINQIENVPTVKKGTYTLANINKWDDKTIGKAPQLELTFKKSGTDFNSFSEVTIPTSGSRSSTFELPSGLKRQNGDVSYFNTYLHHK